MQHAHRLVSRFEAWLFVKLYHRWRNRAEVEHLEGFATAVELDIWNKRYHPEVFR